jgi:hypothetical protein
MKVNFSNLGNLVLGASGAVATFVLAEPLPHNVAIAGGIVAGGIMVKAICSAINEYLYPSVPQTLTVGS